MTVRLTIQNHDRDIAGLKYVYPVISRRAGGLSVGVNFNTNNACNWRCIYCQVPNLVKGSAPDVDLPMLEKELRLFLSDIQDGSFYQRIQVEPDQQSIKDIAISGNGEPTSAKNFAEALSIIGGVALDFGLFPQSRFVLITNGSLIHQKRTQEGLKILNVYGGEVWYKFDSATKKGRMSINETAQSLKQSLENLKISARLCPTKLQTCLFNQDGHDWPESEMPALLEALKSIKQATAIDEIMLYTLARPSMQPEAKQLSALSFEVMNRHAEDIRKLGFDVSVSS